jgi:hypothetical protein
MSKQTASESGTSGEQAAVECRCDDAVENRKWLAKGDPRWSEPNFPLNDDNEIVCSFCWEVLDA